MALCSVFLLMVLSFLAVSGADAAVFTLQNNCRSTVWPGILSGAGHPLLLNGGLHLTPNQTQTIDVPQGWSGRFWGRSGCFFDPSGKGSCATGDCDGKLQCAGTGGAPPATLVEFTLGSPGSPLDFYDVSLVDGYNMPISIVPSSDSCSRVRCVADLNQHCPTGLQVRERERVVACKSACMAYGTPEFCCTGNYGNPTTCVPTNYSRVFKTYCPTAYSYAYDDASSIFTCNGANYLITFC